MDTDDADELFRKTKEGLFGVREDTIFGDPHLTVEGIKFAFLKKRGRGKNMLYVWISANAAQTEFGDKAAEPYVPVPGSEKTWAGWTRISIEYKDRWPRLVAMAYKQLFEKLQNAATPTERDDKKHT